MRTSILTLLLTLSPVLASASVAQEVEGSMVVNGKTAKLTHVLAMEIDSDTEPGYLDVLVVLSDRRLEPGQVRDVEKLEQLAHREKVAALRLVLDPDCKVKSISYYHPAFTVFLVNAGENIWTPSAFDQKVAGRIHSNGRQKAFEQSWKYDFTFSAPIALDPEAVTTP